VENNNNDHLHICGMMTAGRHTVDPSEDFIHAIPLQQPSIWFAGENIISLLIINTVIISRVLHRLFFYPLAQILDNIVG
jgi:hypothetical protein